MRVQFREEADVVAYVESLGFVPTDFVNRGATAYMTDRKSPGAPTEGTDSIWRLTRDALDRVGLGSLVRRQYSLAE